MVRKVSVKTRGKTNRKRKSVLLIGAEGKNETERNYFMSFRNELRTTNIRMAKGNNTDPIGVVNDTLKAMSEIDFTEGDRVYVFLDYDIRKGKENQKNFEIAIKKAKDHEMIPIISNPIFEIWYLLHFKYSTKQFNHNNEVIEELKKYISNYDKSSDVFSLLFGKTKIAIDNSKRLNDYHEQNNNVDYISKHPSSDVYLLIEELMKDLKS